MVTGRVLTRIDADYRLSRRTLARSRRELARLYARVRHARHCPAPLPINGHQYRYRTRTRRTR
jgi:hypothetical protein